MKILIAIDGSEVSLRAVQGVVDRLAWFREPPVVHLLHVHPPVPVGLALEHVSRETLDRYYREEGEAVLAPAAALLERASIETVRHIHVGHPAETIVRVAKELGCDLICLGTHGRGAVASVVIGSVAHKVLQLATLPVLLSR